MFDIRKIKPVHGWRDLLNEIGIIVVGITIALTGELIVERWHTHDQVAEARDALANDVTQLLWTARERELYSGCLARRIDEVGAILGSAAETQRLPAVGPIGSPSIRSYSLPNWQPLTASGLAARFPREELLNYTNLVLSGEEMTTLNRSEMIVWTDLSAIVGSGRAISREEVGHLIRSLGEARYYAKVMRLWDAEVLSVIAKSHFALDAKVDREYSDDAAANRAKIAHRVVCQPLGAAPAVYGQAPLADYSLTGPMGQ